MTPLKTWTCLCAALAMTNIGCSANRDKTPSRPGPPSDAGIAMPLSSTGGSLSSSDSANPSGGLAGSAGLVVTATGGDDKTCASAVVQTFKTMPTVVFLIDGSGSMCAPFGGSTRWQALRSALLDPMIGLVSRLQSSVQFGATLYDGTLDFALALTGAGTGSSAQNPSCALEQGAMRNEGACPQLIDVLPALNNATAIDAAYPAQQLGGSTPTDKALGHVMDALVANQQPLGPDQRAHSPVYVILATDGAPNDICTGGTGGDGSAQRQGVVAAVDRGAEVGIKTWVISLADNDPSLQTHLDEVAMHGDPTNTMAHTFSPTNPDELVMTLAGLLGGAVGCHIELNGKVTVGRECGGTVTANGARLPCCQDNGGAWTCDDAPNSTPSGWHLTDEHSVELVGDACASFLLATDQLLQASFPCDVFTPG